MSTNHLDTGHTDTTSDALVSTSAVLSSRQLRELIRETLICDSDFDAFCLDFFPGVYRHFSAGMERVAKETLLLQSASQDSAYLQDLLIRCRNRSDSLGTYGHVGGNGIRRQEAKNQSPIIATSKLLDLDYVVISGQDGKRTMVPASGHIVRVTVEAIADRTTIIQNICPIIHSRSETTGSLAPHMGVVVPRPFEVLLDENPPCLKPINRRGPNFPFKVSLGDPEIFELKVLTATGDVKWWLELSWTSLGQEGILRIDLGGLPFRTMARPKG